MNTRCCRFSPAIGMGEEARAYRDAVIERFSNPFLDHLLAEIFTNHASKKQRRFGGLIELSEASHVAEPAAPRAALASNEGAVRPLPDERIIPRSPIRLAGKATQTRAATALSPKEESMKKFLIAAALAALAALARRAAPPTADHSDHRQGHHVVLLADRAGRRAQGRQGSRRQRARTWRAVRIRHQRPDFDPRERGRRKSRRGRDRADRSSRRSASRSTRRRRRSRSSASTPPPIPKPSPRS